MKNNNQKKVSFWKEVKNTLSPKAKREFPWLQSGFVLVGFTLGIVATAVITMVSTNIDTLEEPASAEVSEEEKCVELGGRYDRETQSCSTIAEDRGEGCVDNSDCDGWCIVEADAELGTKSEGVCSDEYKVTGCVKYMDNGKVNSICLPE